MTSGGKFHPKHSNSSVSVNISGVLIKLQTEHWSYAGGYTQSVPHYIHSELLAGILSLVMCQGCTEEIV